MLSVLVSFVWKQRNNLYFPIFIQTFFLLYLSLYLRQCFFVRMTFVRKHKTCGEISRNIREVIYNISTGANRYYRPDSVVQTHARTHVLFRSNSKGSHKDVKSFPNMLCVFPKVLLFRPEEIKVV